MPARRSRWSDPTFWSVWLLAALVFALDRVTKAWAEQTLAPVGTLPFAGEWLRFTYVRNTGVAFGLGAGQSLPLVAITLVALGLVAALAFSERSRTWPRSIALGLIVGGAAGNLLDRARWGSVIDFVDFGYRQNWWPVFNAADSAISVGVALFALTLLTERKEPDDSADPPHAPAPGSPGGAGGAA
ncbi:MAG: signal peptidase II [Candidatus Eisenbacteria bacterium]